MRTRAEIKEIGKERFQSLYWPSVAVCAILTVITAVLGVVLGRTVTPGGAEWAESFFSGGGRELWEEIIDEAEWSVSGSSPLGVFVTGPLTIGVCFFFTQLILGRDDTLTVGTPFQAGFANYGRKLGGYLWMELFTFLWSLLFIIPGVIKSFSYAMTPYILGDCPNVKAKDALKLSMRIMRGKKADLFVMYLSFIGWEILSGLTLGLLGIFYVNPYVRGSLACWYLEAREDALRNGVITMGQLEGTEPVL